MAALKRNGLIEAGEGASGYEELEDERAHDCRRLAVVVGGEPMPVEADPPPLFEWR